MAREREMERKPHWVCSRGLSWGHFALSSCGGLSEEPIEAFSKLSACRVSGRSLCPSAAILLVEGHLWRRQLWESGAGSETHLRREPLVLSPSNSWLQLWLELEMRLRLCGAQERSSSIRHPPGALCSVSRLPVLEVQEFSASSET